MANYTSQMKTAYGRASEVLKSEGREGFDSKIRSQVHKLLGVEEDQGQSIWKSIFSTRLEWYKTRCANEKYDEVKDLEVWDDIPVKKGSIGLVLAIQDAEYAWYRKNQKEKEEQQDKEMLDSISVPAPATNFLGLVKNLATSVKVNIDPYSDQDLAKVKAAQALVKAQIKLQKEKEALAELKKQLKR